MPMKYAEAYVELAWRKENYDAGERQVQASIRTIGQQASDMAAKVAAASKSTSADVYELQGSVYKLAETVADVPKEMEKVEERTLATGAAMKNLGGVVGLVSPQLGGMISIAGQLQAKFGVLSQANGATATAATRLGTAFAGLSTTVLAFMGTPVGLMITGFTAVVGLLASTRKEGESLGDTFLRLTDVIHGLASAQEQANREMERGIEIDTLLREREEQRRAAKNESPEGQALEEQRRQAGTVAGEIATLERQRERVRKELAATKAAGPLAVGAGEFDGMSQADMRERQRSLDLDIQRLQQERARQAADTAKAEQDRNRRTLAGILPFDPTKTAAENRADSASKVRDRETKERLEQEQGRTRRSQQEDETRRDAEEKRKQRDEERARKEREQEAKREQEKDRDRKARGALRGMGLDEAERNDLGMAAAFGGIGDIVNSLSRGMDRPDTARQRFGSASAEGFHAQIQQGIQQREEKELMRKQTSDINDIAEGKKEIKVRVVNPQPQVAVFAK